MCIIFKFFFISSLVRNNIFNLGLSSANITKIQLAQKIKNNLKKDRFDNAIFNSFNMSINLIEPVHLDNDFPTCKVVDDENSIEKIIITAPATANGKYASGFSIPLS